MGTLQWLLRETFEPELFTEATMLTAGVVIETGPRLAFQSAWSTNAVAICGRDKDKHILPATSWTCLHVSDMHPRYRYASTSSTCI
jgi:hypothetical protein